MNDLTKEECIKYKQELQFAYEHVGTGLDDASMKAIISLGMVGYESLMKECFELKESNSKLCDEIHHCREKLSHYLHTIKFLMYEFGVETEEELMNIAFNKPYEYEELKNYLTYDSMVYYDAVFRKDCIIAQVWNKNEILVGYYDENGFNEEWIKYEKGRFLPIRRRH